VQEVSKGLADVPYLQRFEQEVPTTIGFLRDHGVEITTGIMGGTVPNGGGLAIVDALAAVLEEAEGAEILYRTEALSLTMADDGRIDGVVVRGSDGLTRTLRARAVVLACGGFEGNPEMLTQYLGPKAVDLQLIAPGIAYNKGRGIRMAMEIGADTSGQFDGMHSELVDRRTSRPDAVIYGHSFGIMVNGEGRRFWDEGAGTYADTFELVAYEVWRNQDQTAFFVSDRKLADNTELSPLYDTDVAPVQADTIEELAVLLGLEADVLAQTVAEFNAATRPGTFDPNTLDGLTTEEIDPPKSNWALPIDTPPYHAYPVTTAITFTYGGVRTDTDARVLSTGGVPIPGLYAAGEIVGVFYHEYVAATSVLKALTFGRIAAEHAVSAAAPSPTR
jgi:tricarballylate dehydrogenase